MLFYAHDEMEKCVRIALFNVVVPNGARFTTIRSAMKIYTLGRVAVNIKDKKTINGY